MWVLVSEVSTEEKNNIIGTLENTPVLELKLGVTYKDTIGFSAEEVIEVSET